MPWWSPGLLVGLYVLARIAMFIGLQRYQPTPIDEILVVILAPLFLVSLYRYSNSFSSALLAFGVYAALGLVSALLTPYGGVPQPAAALVDVVLDSKLLVACMAFYALFRTDPNPRKSLELAFKIIIIGALVNAPFVLRDFFIGGGFGITGRRLVPRLGFHQPQGLLTHHLESTWMSYIATLCALYFMKRRMTMRRLTVALFLVIITLLHLSTKESAALILCASIILMGQMKSAVKILFGLPLVLALLVAAWMFTPVGTLISQQFDNYLGSASADMARTALTVQSTAIAADFFPLGSGAGTFASPPSSQMGYSEVYSAYGLAGIWGLSPETANFITDVFWPKVLAQSGYFGVVAYVLFVLALCGPSIRRYLRNANAETSICLCISISILIISTAASPFSQELLFVIFAMSSAYSLVAERTERRRAAQIS